MEWRHEPEPCYESFLMVYVFCACGARLAMEFICIYLRLGCGGWMYSGQKHERLIFVSSSSDEMLLILRMSPVIRSLYIREPRVAYV